MAERNRGTIPVPLAPTDDPIHFRVRDEYRLSHSLYSLFEILYQCGFLLTCESQKLSVLRFVNVNSHFENVNSINFYGLFIFLCALKQRFVIPKFFHVSLKVLVNFYVTAIYFRYSVEVGRGEIFMCA